MSYVVGVDVGGTFTDTSVIDDKGHVSVGKSLSTPDDYSVGVVNSLSMATKGRVEQVLAATRLFCHGTTIAENALLTGSWPRAALLVTKGFEDTLQIMRGRADYSLSSQVALTSPIRLRKPPPLVAPERVLGISERVDFKGNVLVPLPKDRDKAALNELLSAEVESVGVCFLWSFMNPSHEETIRRMVQELRPGMMVYLSSRVAPLIGEYERLSTTALSACLGPVVSRYLSRLSQKLSSLGLKGPLLVMQCHGGVVPIASAIASPVATVESGPAAGVVASSIIGRNVGLDDIIAADMGGTTFKVCVISKGEVQYAKDPTIMSYSMLTPKIDVVSIGAGGGSVAWIEESTGLLKVGPESAGSKPGPVCYDLGGTEPTVTDADLLLGYVNDKDFAGGGIRLNKAAAREAMARRVGRALGLGFAEAADGVYAITNAQMSDLIRRTTVERGYDPRDFTLFAYGGAGPVHCSALAQELGIGSIVVPNTASVHGAFGASMSDVVHEYIRTEILPVPPDIAAVNKCFDQLQDKAIEELRGEGFTGREQVRITRGVEMRYRRQVHQLYVPVPGTAKVTPGQLKEIYKTFERTYETKYGKGSAYAAAGMEMVNFRVRASGMIKRNVFTKERAGSADASRAFLGTRRCYSRSEKDFVDTDVYDWGSMVPGNKVIGPAVVDSPITSMVLVKGQSARVDEYRNLVVRGQSR